jgi:hypothetical protein
VPVFKHTTRSSGLTQPDAINIFNAATVAAPSRHAWMPSAAATCERAATISSSLTATAVPLDSRTARRMSRSPNGWEDSQPWRDHPRAGKELAAVVTLFKRFDHRRASGRLHAHHPAKRIKLTATRTLARHKPTEGNSAKLALSP